MMKIHKESELSIRCDKCGQNENIYTSDGEYRENDTPSRYFKRRGWNEVNKQTLCKDCRKS